MFGIELRLPLRIQTENELARTGDVIKRRRASLAHSQPSNHKEKR